MELANKELTAEERAAMEAEYDVRSRELIAERA
jgi:hypothetical protein